MIRSPHRLLGRVLCPICLQWIHWNKAPQVEQDLETGDYRHFVPRQPDETLQHFEDRRLGAKRRCTSIRDGRTNVHYLPDSYGDFGDPIVIGLVGDRAAGKTLLLAAMVDELRSSPRLAELGLTVRRLDEGIEQRYMDGIVVPFLRHRKLPSLTRREAITFTYVARVHSRFADREFVVAFFDVAGEQLRHRRAGEFDASFVSAVTALMFVVDPETTVPSVTGEPGGVAEDPTFAAVLDRISGTPSNDSPFLPVSSAVVVAKSDLLKDDHEVVRTWLDRDDDAELGTVATESEQVYEFLVAQGGERLLQPVDRSRDVSMHFVSASGVAPVDGQFPAAGFGPRRVLRPLLSLFAMTGVLDRSSLGDE